MTEEAQAPRPPLRQLPSSEKRETFGKRQITRYSPEIALSVCEAVANGKTLNEVCKGTGMPNRTTFWRWVMLYKDVASAYHSARELSAQALEEEALTMARVLKGPNDFTSVKVRAFDVAMQQLGWSATRRDPGKYGQKAEKSVTVPIQINTTLDLGADAANAQGIYTIKAEIVPPTGKDHLTPPEDPDRLIIPKKKRKAPK
jgi:transposase-like protein